MATEDSVFQILTNIRWFCENIPLLRRHTGGLGFFSSSGERECRTLLVKVKRRSFWNDKNPRVLLRESRNLWRLIRGQCSGLSISSFKNNCRLRRSFMTSVIFTAALVISIVFIFWGENGCWINPRLFFPVLQKK